MSLEPSSEVSLEVASIKSKCVAAAGTKKSGMGGAVGCQSYWHMLQLHLPEGAGYDMSSALYPH